jgi:hypothetical protein
VASGDVSDSNVTVVGSMYADVAEVRAIGALLEVDGALLADHRVARHGLADRVVLAGTGR